MPDELVFVVEAMALHVVIVSQFDAVLEKAKLEFSAPIMLKSL